MRPWMEYDRSDVSFSPVLLSFLAGAASSTLLWWILSRRRGKGPDTDDSFHAVWMDDIKSRIGELPSKRIPWPWNKPSSRSAALDSTREEDTDDDDTASSPPPVSPQEKTGLCIGSIFGLDVGGTLTKLVYFEQQSQEHSVSHREQLHQRIASAQVVLHARRGSSPPLRPRSETVSYAPSRNPLHTIASDKDLQEICLLRQESLPDDTTEPEKFLPHTDFVSQESLVDLITSGKRTPRNGEMKEDGGMKKSRSMLDLSKSREHAQALDRFYNFARRLDGYETAVKDKNLSFYSRELGGEFHFIRFETRRMENAMDLIRVNELHRNIVSMGATGGGAHKYSADWERVLGIKIEKQDELDSLVAGLQFVSSTAIGECYTYRPRLHHRDTSSASEESRATEKAANEKENDTGPQTADDSDRASNQSSDEDAGLAIDDGEAMEPDIQSNIEARNQGYEWWWSRKVQRDVASHSSTYPYMLVTIGTGVSILRVDGPRKHERISGSTIGGGTYWGLIRLLTDVENFEDVMKLAQRGDPSKVDMMVGDIYGKNSDALEKIGLPSNLVASSFGKLVAKRDPAHGIKEEDLARALLLMVTNNIGQVAYLNAKLHHTPRIYFVGNFLRNNQISQQRLSYAINYWSKGEMEALFLEHEGYFGALGAFLLSQGIERGEGGIFGWQGSNRREKAARSVSSVEFSVPHHRRTKTTSSMDIS